MSFQLNLTAGSPLTVTGGTKPRRRLAVLLAALGFAALTSIGALACGRLPADVEVSGPVLRGAVTPPNIKAQPVIMPHCNFTPPADGIAVNAPSERPDNTGTSSASRLAGPN